MTGPTSNKIFAAFLIAGITAYLGAFISDGLISPKKLEQDAVFVDGAAAEGGGGAAVAARPEPIMHLIASADIAQGEKLSKACAACHSFDNGGADKVGPNLWNTVGGPKAHRSAFAYSDGMKNKAGTWGYAELNEFFWKPKSYIEGTKMNYIGMKKPEDRAALIAWLRSLSPSPIALPSAAQIEAEAAALAPPAAEEPAADAAAPAEGEAAPAETPAPAEEAAKPEHG